MKKCVAYCRVSTDSKDQLNSLKNQTEHYQEKFEKDGFASANIGLLYCKDGSTKILKGIFADEGLSGTSTKNRKAFKSMIEFAKKKEFDIIYVKNVSRFARNVEDTTKVLGDLREIGVEVIFEEGNLSSLNGSHQLTINMLAVTAQEESRNKSTSVKFGIKRMLEKGGWTTGEPYGYKIVDGYLKICKEEAETVQTIYKMLLDGNGTGKICRHLNENQIPTKKGKQWSQKQIVSILTNPLYTGKQVTHKKETYDINRKTYKKVDEDEWIIHEKEELRIVDKDRFLAVQAEREKRLSMIKKGNRYSNTHLFSNLLYCGNCGGNLKKKKRHTSRGKDIGYEFTCAINDMYGKSKCNCRNSLTEEFITEKVNAKILEIKEYAQAEMENLMDIYMTVNFNYNTSAEQIDKLYSQRSNIIKRIDSDAQLYADGVLLIEDYKHMYANLRNKLNSIQDEINKIENIEVMKQQERYKFDEFKKELINIDINNLTNKQLKTIFNRVTVKTYEFKSKKRTMVSKAIYYDFKFINMSTNELDKMTDNMRNKLGKNNVPIWVDWLDKGMPDDYYD